jgi:hypothetical protein
MLFFGVLAFIIFMLLPAMIELKKPKDPGPRIIIDHKVLHDIDFGVKSLENERDLEGELKFDRLISKEVSAILAVLPSLEP